MAKQNQPLAAGPNRPQVIAMFMMGGGLLILGLLALILMPKPNPLAENSAGAALAVPVEVNFSVPELNLTDLRGQPVSLAGLRGKVVLVNNWATWCPPCKEEMPTLQQYYDRHHGADFELIAIEAGEPAAQVAEFVQQYGLTFPVWPDAQQQALIAFRNDALPNSYVIDRNGVVRLAWNGAISLKNLERFVTPLFEE